MMFHMPVFYLQDDQVTTDFLQNCGPKHEPWTNLTLIQETKAYPRFALDRKS